MCSSEVGEEREWERYCEEVEGYKEEQRRREGN